MTNYAKMNIGNEGRVELHDTLSLTGAEVSINKIPAGECVPFVHSHKTNEEVYGVLEGEGKAVLDGEDVALRKGDWLRVPPATKRQIFASANSGIVVCLHSDKETDPRSLHFQRCNRRITDLPLQRRAVSTASRVGPLSAQAPTAWLKHHPPAKDSKNKPIAGWDDECPRANFPHLGAREQHMNRQERWESPGGEEGSNATGASAAAGVSTCLTATCSTPRSHRSPQPKSQATRRRPRMQLSNQHTEPFRHRNERGRGYRPARGCRRLRRRHSRQPRPELQIRSTCPNQQCRNRRRRATKCPD